MRGPRNEVRRARCLPQFRYPDVAPIFGMAEMELYGTRGGVPRHIGVARSRSPHLWPQRGCHNRCAWVCVLGRQKSGLSQRANSGATQLVAVATPPTPPTLSLASLPTPRRLWPHVGTWMVSSVAMPTRKASKVTVVAMLIYWAEAFEHS